MLCELDGGIEHGDHIINNGEALLHFLKHIDAELDVLRLI